MNALVYNVISSLLGRAYIQTSSINSSSHFGSHHRCIAEFIFWPQPTKLSATMSQIQFQCPSSPVPAASAPLQLGQPQPGYSIPCASGTLPSESASQPIRSSSLPAGSATPYNTSTGRSSFFFMDSV